MDPDSHITFEKSRCHSQCINGNGAADDAGVHVKDAIGNADQCAAVAWVANVRHDEA